MNFTNGFQPPAGLQTDEFILRPIRASDAELDYAAVMESREFLRRWEQSTWPADDFTVDANRADMVKLEQRHAAGESFTYTVMNPTETQCLGCVYLSPITARYFTRSQITAIDGAEWSDYVLGIHFWIRKSRLADGLDRRLLDTLGPWLTNEWRIPNHLFVTNEQFEQQVTMIEDAGYALRFRLDRPNEPGNSLAFASDASGMERRPPTPE